MIGVCLGSRSDLFAKRGCGLDQRHVVG
jgi:hypothetical protein